MVRSRLQKNAFSTDSVTMKILWFVHREGTVLGPYTTAEVESRISSGSLGEDSMIWARGTNEWSPVAKWKALSSSLEESSKKNNNRIWYCDSGLGHPAGPLNQTELIEHLKGINRWDTVTLWGTGLSKWLPLFEVPEVMDLVGISRRAHPRAPLLGQAALTPVGSTIPAQLLPTLTVSIGGFGVKNAGFLHRGDLVQISIRSREIPSAVHATGEVLYVSRNGEAGIKFRDLSTEAQSVLFDHIRRFNEGVTLVA
ncbi:MAG: GYF domain-containing protein [Bdellovibrionales bacterium]|jgi:hypothetical protein|nr:GYF domain-containing protein [Bdellovibrionales bacterium]